VPEKNQQELVVKIIAKEDRIAVKIEKR